MTLTHLAALLDDLEWKQRAACRELPTEYFFYGDGTRGGKEVSKKVKDLVHSTCAGCGVRTECLDYAISTNQPGGIWGGLTPSQRKRWRRTG